MKRFAQAALLAAGLFAMLYLIGVLAFQLGGHHRFALTLDGVDSASRFGLLWKTLLCAVALAWWRDFLKHRKPAR